MLGQPEKIEIKIVCENTGNVLNHITCISKSITDLAFAWKGAVAPYQHKQVNPDLLFTVEVKVNQFIEKELKQTLMDIERMLK